MEFLAAEAGAAPGRMAQVIQSKTGANRRKRDIEESKRGNAGQAK
jgi:hypothetical protein